MDGRRLSTSTQHAKRMLRGHQPARALLFDLSHSLDLQVWQRLLSSLHGFFSLVCNMAGPPRIPLVSFYVLDAFPEVILPFSPPKGNLCRVLSALRDVRGYVEEKHVSTGPRPVGCVDLGMVEACGQYRRHLNAMGQLQANGGSLGMDQLEVVVLSGATPTAARAMVNFQHSQLDLTHLKRLVLALLTVNPLDELDSPHSSSSNPRDCEDHGMVDIVHLETDSSSLQKFFYSWLLDSSSDSEHLHLTLPAACSADRELLVKCDIVERIINPTQLPHHEYLNLHADSAHCKTVFPCPSKAAGLSVPVYSLAVQAAIPLNSICDSLLFGLPLLVQATSCWRIDWEELENNTGNFHALCHELRVKGQALLVQLNQTSTAPPKTPPQPNTTITTATAPPTPSSTRNLGREAAAAGSGPKIRGMYVLLPAPEGSCLLLKAIATGELVLPTSWSSSVGSAGAAGGEGDAAENALRVQSSLTQVPELTGYNPLCHSSGLVDVLLSQAAPKQQAVRPRPAAKRKSNQSAKETEGLDRTWSEMSSHVTPTSGGRRQSVGVGPAGNHSAPSGGARGGHPGNSSSVDMGRNRVITASTRLSDGFLVDLE